MGNGGATKTPSLNLHCRPGVSLTPLELSEPGLAAHLLFAVRAPQVDVALVREGARVAGSERELQRSGSVTCNEEQSIRSFAST